MSTIVTSNPKKRFNLDCPAGRWTPTGYLLCFFKPTSANSDPVFDSVLSGTSGFSQCEQMSENGKNYIGFVLNKNLTLMNGKTTRYGLAFVKESFIAEQTEKNVKFTINDAYGNIWDSSGGPYGSSCYIELNPSAPQEPDFYSIQVQQHDGSWVTNTKDVFEKAFFRPSKYFYFKYNLVSGVNSTGTVPTIQAIIETEGISEPIRMTPVSKGEYYRCEVPDDRMADLLAAFKTTGVFGFKLVATQGSISSSVFTFRGTRYTSTTNLFTTAAQELERKVSNGENGFYIDKNKSFFYRDTKDYRITYKLNTQLDIIRVWDSRLNAAIDEELLKECLTLSNAQIVQKMEETGLFSKTTANVSNEWTKEDVEKYFPHDFTKAAAPFQYELNKDHLKEGQVGWGTRVLIFVDSQFNANTVVLNYDNIVTVPEVAELYRPEKEKDGFWQQSHILVNYKTYDRDDGNVLPYEKIKVSTSPITTEDYASVEGIEFTREQIEDAKQTQNLVYENGMYYAISIDPLGNVKVFDSTLDIGNIDTQPPAAPEFSTTEDTFKNSEFTIYFRDIWSNDREVTVYYLLMAKSNGANNEYTVEDVLNSSAKQVYNSKTGIVIKQNPNKSGDDQRIFAVAIDDSKDLSGNPGNKSEVATSCWFGVNKEFVAQHQFIKIKTPTNFSETLQGFVDDYNVDITYPKGLSQASISVNGTEISVLEQLDSSNDAYDVYHFSKVTKNGVTVKASCKDKYGNPPKISEEVILNDMIVPQPEIHYTLGDDLDEAFIDSQIEVDIYQSRNAALGNIKLNVAKIEYAIISKSTPESGFDSAPLTTLNSSFETITIENEGKKIIARAIDDAGIKSKWNFLNVRHVDEFVPIAPVISFISPSKNRMEKDVDDTDGNEYFYTNAVPVLGVQLDENESNPNETYVTLTGPYEAEFGTGWGQTLENLFKWNLADSQIEMVTEPDYEGAYECYAYSSDLAGNDSDYSESLFFKVFFSHNGHVNINSLDMDSSKNNIWGKSGLDAYRFSIAIDEGSIGPSKVSKKSNSLRYRTSIIHASDQGVLDAPVISDVISVAPNSTITLRNIDVNPILTVIKLEACYVDLAGNTANEWDTFTIKVDRYTGKLPKLYLSTAGLSDGNVYKDTVKITAKLPTEYVDSKNWAAVKKVVFVIENTEALNTPKLPTRTVEVDVASVLVPEAVLDLENPNTVNSKYTFSIKVQTIDEAGNTSILSEPTEIIFNNIGPEFTATLNPTNVGGVKQSTNLVVTSTNPSVNAVKYTLGTDPTKEISLDEEVLISKNGNIVVRVEDRLGNYTEKTLTVDFLDFQPPTITATPSTTSTTTQPVTITVASIDEELNGSKSSGVKSVKYVMGDWSQNEEKAQILKSNTALMQPIEGSFNVKYNGIYSIYSDDMVGNVAPIKVVNVANIDIPLLAKPTVAFIPTAYSDLMWFSKAPLINVTAAAKPVPDEFSDVLTYTSTTATLYTIKNGLKETLDTFTETGKGTITIDLANYDTTNAILLSCATKGIYKGSSGDEDIETVLDDIFVNVDTATVSKPDVKLDKVSSLTAVYNQDGSLKSAVNSEKVQFQIDVSKILKSSKSGIAKVEYGLVPDTGFFDESNYVQYDFKAVSMPVVEVTGKGNHTYKIRVTNNAGVQSEVMECIFSIDNTVPVAPTFSPNSVDWTNKNVSITLGHPSLDANSKIMYKIENSNHAQNTDFTKYITPLIIEGNCVITAKFVNLFGIESAETVLTVDKIFKSVDFNLTKTVDTKNELDKLSIEYTATAPLTSIKYFRSSTQLEQAEYTTKFDSNDQSIVSLDAKVREFVISSAGYYYVKITDACGNTIIKHIYATLVYAKASLSNFRINGTTIAPTGDIKFKSLSDLLLAIQFVEPNIEPTQVKVRVSYQSASMTAPVYLPSMTETPELLDVTLLDEDIRLYQLNNDLTISKATVGHGQGKLVIELVDNSTNTVNIDGKFTFKVYNFDNDDMFSLRQTSELFSLLNFKVGDTAPKELSELIPDSIVMESNDLVSLGDIYEKVFGSVLGTEI